MQPLNVASFSTICSGTHTDSTGIEPQGWILGDARAFKMTTASGQYTTHELMFGITFQNNYMFSPAWTGTRENVKSDLPVLTNKVNFAYLY